MTLEEISKEYKESAKPIRRRLHELRVILSEAQDPEEIWHIKRRIAELTPMLTQLNELAELTAHYYDHSHYTSRKYSTINMSPADTTRKEKLKAKIESEIGQAPTLAEEPEWEDTDKFHISKAKEKEL